MLALLSPRLWLALALAVALAASHWKAYVSGKHAIQLEWDADTAQRTAEALRATQEARDLELHLNAKVRKVNDDYQTERRRRLAADSAAADSLRQLTAALAAGGQARADPAAAGRADDDPRDGIVAECAGALVRLDQAARSLASQTVALQGYAAGVCVSQPP